jgi:prepilin-type N-terminal cleavage/methylation domain-containing protein
MATIRGKNGFTLMEIIVVIVIMGIIATVALRSIGNSLDNAKVENTKHEMQQLSYAIAGNPDLFSSGMRTDFGYVGDIGAMPPNLDALVTNPGGYSTWRGPYVRNSFSESNDDFKRDAWGSLYNYSDASIQSSGGGGGTLTKEIATSVNDLTQNTVSGSVTDGAGNPPGDSASAVTVHLRFPDGSGGYADSTRNVSSSGAFEFSDLVPIGNHRISAVYSATADTAVSYVSVLPGGESFANLRFSGLLWGAGGPTGPGGSPSDLEYVAGSGRTQGGNNDEIVFEVSNNGSAELTIDWIVVIYSHAPTAYYERVRWNNGSVFFSNNPRAAGGDTANFNASKSLSSGDTAELKLQGFSDSQSGGASPVDMRNVDITVDFSDGSQVTFNTGS